MLIQALLRHYDELTERLHRRFGDKNFARDVMQDVCVQLLERPPKTTIRTPFAFLRRVSTHLAIDRYRHQTRQQLHIDYVADLPEHASLIPTPEQSLQARQELDQLISLIENLPPRCREVFVMHKIHQLSQAEVAARLNISRQMVEKHLRIAMNACRQQLQRGSPHES